MGKVKIMNMQNMKENLENALDGVFGFKSISICRLESK